MSTSSTLASFFFKDILEDEAENSADPFDILTGGVKVQKVKGRQYKIESSQRNSLSTVKESKQKADYEMVIDASEKEEVYSYKPFEQINSEVVS